MHHFLKVKRIMYCFCIFEMTFQFIFNFVLQKWFHNQRKYCLNHCFHLSIHPAIILFYQSVMIYTTNIVPIWPFGHGS
jgi:hypothetical protein